LISPSLNVIAVDIVQARNARQLPISSAFKPKRQDQRTRPEHQAQQGDRKDWSALPPDDDDRQEQAWDRRREEGPELKVG
jgi:hypothetical protein